MQGRISDVPPLDNFDPTLWKCDYFHGLLPREDTVSLLNKNGDFLVRISEGDSQGAKLVTVISVLHDPKSCCRGTSIKDKEDFIMHVIVEYAKRKYSVASDRGFSTVPELISYYSKSPMCIRSQQVRLKEGIRLGTWEYKAEDIFLEQVIGMLSCGNVRKGRARFRGQPVMTVAIKTVPGRSSSAKVKITELMRECRLLRELSHPCIRQFYGVCLMAQPHCFVMEYVYGVPLDTYLRENKGNIIRDELLMMVCCAGWGLEYLHDNEILHRDIAAKNCLYDRQYVKLIGFSMSKKGTVYSMKTTRHIATRWAAPETLTSYQYVQKTDVYGYGILIYEIFSAQEPYEGLSNIEAKSLILDGVLNEFPGITPRKLAEVTRDKMWAMQPESRSAMFQRFVFTEVWVEKCLLRRVERRFEDTLVASIMLWLRVYTGMELKITTEGNVAAAAAIRKNVDALVAKDIELQEMKDFREPGRFSVLQKRRKKGY